MPGRCAQCRKAASSHDRLLQRIWDFVPLWGVPTRLLYSPRRVNCTLHGIGVEDLPWSAGKRPVSIPMMLFLAQWHSCSHETS